MEVTARARAFVVSSDPMVLLQMEEPVCVILGVNEAHDNQFDLGTGADALGDPTSALPVLLSDSDYDRVVSEPDQAAGSEVVLLRGNTEGRIDGYEALRLCGLLRGSGFGEGMGQETGFSGVPAWIPRERHQTIPPVPHLGPAGKGRKADYRGTAHYFQEFRGPCRQ